MKDRDREEIEERQMDEDRGEIEEKGVDRAGIDGW